MRINGADHGTSIGHLVNILTGDVTLQFIIWCERVDVAEWWMESTVGPGGWREINQGSIDVIHSPFEFCFCSHRTAQGNPDDASNGWERLEIHFCYSSSSPSINGCRSETVINLIKEQIDCFSLFLPHFANFTLYNETLMFRQIEGPLLWISSLTSLHSGCSVEKTLLCGCRPFSVKDSWGYRSITGW